MTPGKLIKNGSLASISKMVDLKHEIREKKHIVYTQYRYVSMVARVKKKSKVANF